MASYERFTNAPEPGRTQSSDLSAPQTRQPLSYSAPQESAPYQAPQESAPYQAPQLLVLPAPERQPRPTTVARRKQASLKTGILVLILSVFQICLLIALFATDTSTQPPKISFQIFILLGPAVIGTFVTAALSLYTGLRTNKCCLIAALVMCIIVTVVFGAYFIFFVSLGAVQVGSVNKDPSGPSIVSYCLVIVAGLVSLVVAIAAGVQSVYSCTELCRCCEDCCSHEDTSHENDSATEHANNMPL